MARVALAVLVFTTTDSAVLTGLTFALTYVPTLLGGIFLSGLGDRFPRREVMVAANVVQAVQGVGALVAGAFAQVFTPAGGMAVVGCIGVVLAAGPALAWRRVANPAQLAVQLTG